jgi:hypothetical protein
MDALTSGAPHKLKRFIASRAASALPFSAAVRGLAQSSDPVYREAETLLEKVWDKNVPAWGVPGSSGLPPSRNIFGEQVLRPPGVLNRGFNPFTFSFNRIDPTLNELVELGRGLSMPASKVPNTNIDLKQLRTPDGQQAYDRLLGGMPKRNLRERLEEKMQTDGWKKASGANDIAPGGAKWLMAAEIINRYQAAAFKVLQREMPELRDAMKAERKARMQALKGGSDQDRGNAIVDLLQGN